MRQARATLAFLAMLAWSCAAEQDSSLDQLGAVDVYTVAWPESANDFAANGTWQTEHRWDDQVSGVTYERGFAYWVATLHGESPRIAPPPTHSRLTGDDVEVPVLDCANWVIALRFAFAATHRLSFQLYGSATTHVSHEGFVGFAPTSIESTDQVLFFEQLGLSHTTATFGARILAQFGATNLADDRSTYRVAFAHVLPGDFFSTGFHAQLIGQLTRSPAAVRIAESSPGYRPSWNLSSLADFLGGVSYGTGPRRFRTEAPMHVAGDTQSENALWEALFDVPLTTRLSASLDRYYTVLQDRPTSCHTRTRLLNTAIQLFEAERAEGSARTWRSFLESEYYIYTNCLWFPELEYEVSPTCAWNPSAEENAAISATLIATSPFYMRNGRYPAPFAPRWRNDEGRNFSSMNDVLSSRVCSCAFDPQLRAALGCVGEVPNMPPPIRPET